MCRRLAGFAIAASIAVSTAASMAPQAQAADGLTAPPGEQVWPQWQARLTVSTTTLNPVSLVSDPLAHRSALQSGSLLSDYYLPLPAWHLSSALGGLRATGEIGRAHV